MKNFLRYWLPTIAYMALIFYLSSRSQFPVEAPDWMAHADKVVHCLLYAALGFLFLRALVKGDLTSCTLQTVLLAIVLTSVYGITDEFHQSFVPGRTPDVFDWLWDTIGALSICVFLFWRKRRLQEAPAD